jgi:protein phosphatase 1L
LGWWDAEHPPAKACRSPRRAPSLSSPDGTAAFGFALARGRRATMEDFCAAGFREHPELAAAAGAFAVFDGHGGARAAAYAAARLFDLAFAHPALAADPGAALAAAFEAVDAAYVSGGGGDARSPVSPRSPTGSSLKTPRTPPNGPPPADDGCTAVAALVTGDALVVAHVGDSRAVLVEPPAPGAPAGTPPVATALSQDHKPDRVDERARIEAAGGAVVWAGAWRVGGVLAVSRAIGDAPLKPCGVTAVPEVALTRLSTLRGGRSEGAEPGSPTTALSFPPLLVLASDGVWDVLSNDTAASVAAGAAGAAGDAAAAARALAGEALRRGTADNVSVIVVRLGAAGVA